MSTVSAGWLTVILDIREEGLAVRPSLSMTSVAVARLFAISTYDLARDLARVSPIDPTAGSELLPVLTKPFALAAYTLVWVTLNRSAARTPATVRAATP